MLPHERWADRQAREDHERERLEQVFPTTPKGWSKRTPRPVWDKTDEVCKHVFDGDGMRLIAKCPSVQPKWQDPEQMAKETFTLELVCLDGSTPDERRRRLFREAFFPEATSALVAIHRSQTGVLTYQLPVSVLE
jgi:hypothetical protein